MLISILILASMRAELPISYPILTWLTQVKMPMLGISPASCTLTGGCNIYTPNKDDCIAASNATGYPELYWTLEASLNWGQYINQLWTTFNAIQENFPTVLTDGLANYFTNETEVRACSELAYD